jgi:hypothetical protein
VGVGEGTGGGGFLQVKNSEGVFRKTTTRRREYELYGQSQEHTDGRDGPIYLTYENRPVFFF